MSHAFPIGVAVTYRPGSSGLGAVRTGRGIRFDHQFPSHGGRPRSDETKPEASLRRVSQPCPSAILRNSCHCGDRRFVRLRLRTAARAQDCAAPPAAEASADGITRAAPADRRAGRIPASQQYGKWWDASACWRAAALFERFVVNPSTASSVLRAAEMALYDSGKHDLLLMSADEGAGGAWPQAGYARCSRGKGPKSSSGLCSRSRSAQQPRLRATMACRLNIVFHGSRGRGQRGVSLELSGPRAKFGALFPMPPRKGIRPSRRSSPAPLMALA